MSTPSPSSSSPRFPLVGTVRTRVEQPVWRVWACFAVLMAAGVGTQSRAALVAVVGMILVAVLTGLLALRFAGALLAVVTTAAALVIAVLPLPVGQALTDPQRYSDTNIAQRDDVRLVAYEMARASPVVGLGPGAFPLFHQDYRDDDDHYRSARPRHRLQHRPRDLGRARAARVAGAVRRVVGARCGRPTTLACATAPAWPPAFCWPSTGC